MQGILTILRDRETTRGDFIFFTDRLSTFLAEKATEFLPYRPKSVVTPVDVTSIGKEIAAEVRQGLARTRVHLYYQGVEEAMQEEIQIVCG